MAFVHRQSCEGVKTELDLFTVPPTQNCIADSHVVEHQPMASLDSGGPIEFFIPGSGDDYMDLANTMLHLQVKVTRANGNPIDAGEPVGPVNNWLHSLFSHVDLSLNGTLVTSSSFNSYPYRSYIETLLSYGFDAKSTQLTNQLWYKDKASRMHATELAAGPDPNPGFVTRREYIAGSRVVDMMGRLHVDMFLQDKFLINGVDVKLRLKATINPAVQKAHIMALERTTVKYPLRPVECKVYSIPTGALSHTHENLFLGALPKRLVLCCIDNDAYNGTYATNPFHAKNNAISFVSVYVDGRQIPAKPFQPNFAENLFARSYASMFTSTGKIWQDEGNGLTRDEYRDGYTFFCFDLTPDQCDGPCFNLVQKGNLRLEFHFRAALRTTVNVVAYAEFESVLEIDKNRNVIYDY
ncbi:hypothetical protein LSAT2_005325 [Lamellibrachia satsuma]|nr:hypothetical protein LSAT2_005325 [Lamellibrachia satsuma]